MSRPFDEARYKGLLEGLDTTVLKLSEVRSDNDKFRIDDAYFSKAAVLALRRIESLPHVRLGEVTREFRKGIFDIKADSYVENGIPFVRIADLKNGLIDTIGMAHISPEVHAAEVKTALRLGDIVLSKTAIPAASFVNLDECNVSQDTIAVRLAQVWKEQLRSAFVVAFLNSRYGLALMERQFQGNVQAHLSLPDGKKLSLPLFSLSLQDAVQNAYLLAHEKLQEARKHTTEAEQTLLRALGLENWQPPEPLTYIRRASDAFAAGRLDADYFAPRVAELLCKLGEAGLTIGTVAPARHERFVPGKQGEFDYIEIGNLRADGTADSERLPQNEAPSRATQFVRAGDVLTSSVRPIRRLSALVTQEQNGFVCSSGFVVLQPHDVPAEVLLTYLRLPPVCELMDLHTSASLYPAISEADLLALPFHPIAEDVEEEIINAIQSAHEARRQAHALLEAAKRAVEIAIEECEAAALAYLKENSELS